MRALLALLILAGACYVGSTFIQHHESESVFATLYMHLVPSPLVKDPHAPHHEQERVLDVPLPAFLGFMDVDHGAGAGHGDDPVSEHGHGGAIEHADSTAGPHTTLFNLQVYQLAAVLLVLVLFSGVPGYLRTGQGGWLMRVLAGWAMWIRDEMVYPVMGRESGARFLPFFLSLFFFIVFMNLMGLVPFSATPTASIFVTGALALVTFVAMIGCGMAAQGPIGFFKGLVPHVPWWLWLPMLFVELIGLVVKPFALTVRLFANMTGGHMVVLSFMGLIFFFAGKFGAGGGWGSAPLGLGFAVFIMIIEVFVALLQAYIFTQLSIIFVQASIHPEH